MRQEEFVQFELQPAKGLVEGVTVSEHGISTLEKSVSNIYL